MLAPLLIGAAPPRVEIQNLAQPGSFEIQAAGGAVSLAAEAHVEKQTPGGWVTVATNFLLLEKCPDGDPPRCVDLAPGARLHPVRWTGFSCSGQCNQQCKKNVYEGPGSFRLIVFRCDRAERFQSAPFQLPATPP